MGERAGRNVSMANVALGLFTNYAELGQRNFTRWRSLATDAFIQDSWKPRTNLTIEGGVRWVYWPPRLTTNNISSFMESFYDRNNQAVMDRSTGLLVSGPRYNGVVLPGDGFKGDAANSPLASNPAITALFRGVPRGFSETHANAFEPRVGLNYALNAKTVVRLSTGIFHNRATLNDSTLLGGNVPFNRRRRSKTARLTIRAERRWVARTCRLRSPRRIRCSSTRLPTCFRRGFSVKSGTASRWTSPMWVAAVCKSAA